MALVNMIKGGVVIGVHETCVAAHERQGWAVTAQEAPVADVVEDDPTDDEKQALADARAEYKDLTDKKAHHSWSAEDIASKLAELTE